MVTFLWMLYLALTIYMSLIVITNSIININYDKNNKTQVNDTLTSQLIFVSLLWSIWYIYYLN
jgi:hypothetical protein